MQFCNSDNNSKSLCILWITVAEQVLVFGFWYLKYPGNNLSEQSREPTNLPHMRGLGHNLTQATLVEGEYLNPAHVYLQANQLQEY